MDVRLLGALEVRDGGRLIELPRRQQRALLAALALRAGEVVSTDRLVADLWGERPPASAVGSLQNTVSALRKLLGRDVLVTHAPGYRLALSPEDVDAIRFERLLAEARQAEPAAAARLLTEALALWRGPALAELDEEDFARLAAARLEELRVTAVEERIDAELALGRHAALVGELEALVAAHPLREHLRGQLMLALYRCGRQAESLEVYRAARLALADELGLDPSPELQELERRILRQDAALNVPAEEPDAPAAATAERRLVTVLAAVPPADEDAERHRALLHETLAGVHDALSRNDGVLERFGPEGLVAVFGGGSPRDDDAQRALATAEELGLAAGIATGELVGGVGAVVTRAVELARAGGLELDERTRALVSETRRFDTPLVGRERELSELQAALAEPGCSVRTVLGEPGIGKTRLARELALRAGEANVLVARCLAYGKGATFLPLLGALQRAEPERALAGADDAELVLSRLAALAGGDDPSTLGESYWAVRRLLESLSPALLILDDVHWAEPALLDLVEYLGERTQRELLVLCLARPELERRLGSTIRLDALPDHHARALVPAELGEETRERIVELAEGNPLYVEQLSSYAAEGGEGLPPTLEAVLAGRLGRLDDDERAVAQRAAVVGREFTRGGVAALCDAPVDAALSSLSRRRFVHPAPAAEATDDGYAFHHVLLRDAAYATLTKADRAGLHERAAAWLDRDGVGDDALVGYHLEQAVLYRRELGDDADELAGAAGERLGEAGMRVWRANDVAGAVGLLGRAVALLPASGRRAELHWERSIALRLHDRPDEADDALEQAEKDALHAGTSSIVTRVASERAYARLNAGELPLDESVAIFAQAERDLRTAGDARGLGRAELFLGNVHHLACRYEELRAAAERAERHYAAAGRSAGVCVSIQAEALYYGPTPVARCLVEGASLLNRSQDEAARAAVTAVLGGLRALEGRCDEGRELLARARELFEDVGNERGLLTIWSPLAVALETIAGDRDAAEAEAERAYEALRAAGDHAYASTAAVQLAELLIDRQDADAADAYVVRAHQSALASDVLVQFWMRSARARLLARAGELDAAETLAREAVTIASLADGLRDRARAHFALAEVLRLAGKPEEAQAAATAGRTLLRRKGATALLDVYLTPALAARRK